MEAPSSICRQLADFHPQLRLGWDAERSCFGLVQLYNRRAAQGSFRERWGSRGPLFSKTGRPTPDWDSWSRVPIYIIDVSPRDVHSGKIVRLVKRWVRPIFARVHEDAVEQARAVQRKAAEIGREGGAEMYRDAMRDNSGGAPIIAKKFAETSSTYDRYKSGEMFEDMAAKVIPPAPKGGWDKHVADDLGDAGDLGSVGGAA